MSNVLFLTLTKMLNIVRSLVERLPWSPAVDYFVFSIIAGIAFFKLYVEESPDYEKIVMGIIIAAFLMALAFIK